MASRKLIAAHLAALTASGFNVPIIEPRKDPVKGNIPGSLDFWVLDLEDLTDEQVNIAFSHFRRNRTSDFGGKTVLSGDIRALVQLTQSGGWSEAWKEYFDRAMTPVYGLNARRPDWKSETAKKVCNRLGGLNVIREAEADQMPFIQAQFKKHFDEIQQEQAITKTLEAAGISKAQISKPHVLELEAG